MNQKWRGGEEGPKQKCRGEEGGGGVGIRLGDDDDGGKAEGVSRGCGLVS